MTMRENNWTIPNLLTVVRIMLTPVVVMAFIHKRVDLALLSFFVAGITDALDGLLARLLKQRTELGAMLDPLADKVLIVATILCLGILEWVPAWLVVIVITRDLIIVGGLMLVNLWGVDVRSQIRPTFASKTNTSAQIVLILLILTERMDWMFLPWLQPVVLYLTAVLTVYTGIDYVMRGLALIPSGEDGKG
ncbi:CDP-alcohol phosphatidyltransferase family protein [Desulfovibrio ferrophilus]|uniref:CDP-diacylglycerol--glycerol-3-phosphate 3-phosphatidyltransferase n=1 Tax=Desulfovibrio ferrophilus TaxID=241368 RepID=A0A2Z6AWB2_9BACT|nr:CDP-alcohol phosphatidyltransferase family protein [Desulfovibrio ferrophilus]BBD07466.1 CDP-diacylglycerol--glycerol-3-phosphate 3-phosphatidyltransferase [Desulfovibrio ferrophilus]